MINRRKSLLLMLSLGTMLGGCTFSSGNAPCTAELTYSAEQITSKQELAALYADDEKWSHFLTEVKAANQAALQLARRLSDVSDAGASNGLDLAFAAALSISPERVLGLDFPSDRLPLICGGIDDEDAKCQTKKACIDQMEMRLKIVSEVMEPRLKEERRRCVKYIKEGIGILETSGFWG